MCYGRAIFPILSQTTAIFMIKSLSPVISQFLINMAIHILVYTMFVGEIPKGMTINHKDGNHENNQLNNLELATYSENMQHSYDILKRTSDKPKYKYIIQNTI